MMMIIMLWSSNISSSAATSFHLDVLRRAVWEHILEASFFVIETNDYVAESKKKVHYEWTCCCLWSSPTGKALKLILLCLFLQDKWLWRLTFFVSGLFFSALSPVVSFWSLEIRATKYIFMTVSAQCLWSVSLPFPQLGGRKTSFAQSVTRDKKPQKL